MKTRKASLAWSVLAIVTLLSLVLAAACGPPPTEAPAPTEAPTEAPAPTKAPEVTAEGSPYKIGFASAITGPASSLGVPERDCAEMLAQEVTEVVGPDGVKHPVEIIIYDTEGSGETAVTVVNKMISEDEVVAVVAGSRSPVSVALVPVTAEAEVPYVSMASSSAIVEPVEEHYWAFKTPQSNDPVAYNQVGYLKHLGVTKIASLYVNDAFGEDSRAGLQKWVAEAGIEIVLEESFEAQDADMTAQLTKVKASDAEALVVHAIPPAASIITTQFRELGLDIPLLHNHGVCNKTFIELAGVENAEGTIFPCGKMLVAEGLPDTDSQKQVLLDFIADYEAFSGNPRSTFAGHAWDAFQLVFSALESLPDGLSLEEQRAAVRDHIENETAGFVGTGGVFQISSEDHNGLGPDSMVLLKVVDGEWTYFGPEKWVAKEGAPYKIGFASAITGPASSLGVPERDCAQMLAEEVMEVVGSDGVKHPLEIIIYDTEGAGETAVTVVNKMISEDQVVAVVAGSRSPVSVALVPVTAEAEVPYVSMASSSAIVEPVEEHYWAFKTPQSNDPVAYNQVEYLKHLGVTKVASLYVNDAFGEDSRAGLQKWAAEAGIEIVLEESFEAQDADMTAQLTKVKASDAEALVVHAIPPAASIITTQFRELGLDMPLIHNHGVCNKTFIELAGVENAEGAIFPCGKMLVAEGLPDADPQKQVLLDFIADYEAFSANPRSTFAGHAWDAFQLVFLALESLPDGLSLEEQRAAVRDYIENETAGFVGTGGTFQISAKDHNGLGPDSMTLLKVVDGEWTYFGSDAW